MLRNNIHEHPSIFFQISHGLTPFLIFSVHVNWIVFYVTAHLFKFYYQQILRKICHTSWRKLNRCNNSVWIWKMVVDETRVIQRQPFVDVFKISVLKNFVTFIGKNLCWSLFLIKLHAWDTVTLLKRRFKIGVFLWILRNFYKQLFL